MNPPQYRYIISLNDIEAKGDGFLPRKSMESLTESMFYVLMAFCQKPMCGIDVADYIDRRTRGRLQIGPATLYTILSKFESERYIREIQVEGRKRTYKITERGLQAYEDELERLRHCIYDAETAAKEKEE